jgi:deoxyribonuclease-4
MVQIGVHVSIAGGVDKAVERAAEKGCDLFQIFSRNPRGWSSKPLSPEDAEGFVRRFKESGLSLAVDHMPYLPNLASPKEDVYLRSVEALAAELVRCHQLHIPFLVTHMGSHLGMGWEQGFMRIVAAIEKAFDQADNKVMLLLENTAGTRNSMGSSFEDIAAIIDALDARRLGICLDTCHLFAAGYDLRTAESLQATLDQFQSAIGLQKLLLLHLNDCRGDLAARMDRHEHVGLGKIGEQGFRAILNHPSLRSLPIIMETPVDSRRDDLGNLRAARTLALARE